MAELRIFTGGAFFARASRWPWQKGSYRAPLNPRGARFGGGWDFALGVRLGLGNAPGWTASFDLGWGIVALGYRSAETVRWNDERAAAAKAALAKAMEQNP